MGWKSTRDRHRLGAPRRPGASFAALAVVLALAASACGEEQEPLPPPGELQVGVAVGRIPAPVGVGTAGFRGFGLSGPESPYSDLYPSTVRVHGHPQFRAMVISRGPSHQLIFLRSDTVGVFQQLRRAVVLELEERLGYSVDHQLVFGGTHTHSGPGRVLDGGPVYELITDKFFPEMYERLVDAAADTVMEAMNDLQPARIGHARGQCPACHEDRRCEDGANYENSALPIVAVERNGRIEALLIAFAIHGTLLGIEEFTLSRDVSGAIEEYVEASFDHPVTVVYFNSWGADMAPGEPEVELVAGAPQPGGYQRMTEIGGAMAAAVQEALPSISWETEPELFAEVHRVPLNREAIGYADDEFLYEAGGVFCQDETRDDCDPSTTIDDLDGRCVAFPLMGGPPQQTELSAGRIGELAFVTFPGEPGTLLAEELLSRLEERGEDTVMFLGYAQDFTGYSLLEDDWWQGGYEASGGTWGPRQGEYLIDMALRTFERVVIERKRDRPFKDAPEALEPFVVSGYQPVVATPGVGVGTIATDVSASYGPEEVVSVVVQGEDPWLGAPRAQLVTETGEPVLSAGGKPIDSDGYVFWADLAYEPTYEEARDAESRTFLWTISMPAQLTVPGLLPELAGGSYRLRVTLPTASGEMEVDSGVFAIAAP